ncbi:MAG: hypothetical protein R3B82_24990 [Sandaracinaceae bacterium]
MTDATPVPTPLWLRAVFVVEALGWLVQVLLATIFTIYATAVPDRPLEIGYLVLQLLGAVGAAAIFVAGTVRPMRHPPAARFAITHAGAGLAVGLPLALATGATAVARIGASDWGDAASSAVFALSFVAIPVGALLLGRSGRPPLVVLAAVGALLWLLLCALALVGVGVGVAGVSA